MDHECQPPSSVPSLKSVWRCECDALWQVKKPVIFDYSDDNRGWYPAGPVARVVNFRKKDNIAWAQ